MNKTLSVLFICVSILVGCDNNAQREVVQEKNGVKIVVFPDNKDKNYFRDAIPKYCPKEVNCQVLFAKSNLVHMTFPVSEENLNEMIVYYSNQVEPRKKSMRWNCNIFPNTSKSICLDSKFIETIFSHK